MHPSHPGDITQANFHLYALFQKIGLTLGDLAWIDVKTVWNIPIRDNIYIDAVKIGIKVLLYSSSLTLSIIKKDYVKQMLGDHRLMTAI